MTRALVIKTYGDKQIAGAIADGVEKGREESEARKWKRTAALVRVAVGNTKTAGDYACMVQKSRYEHQVVQNHGRLYEAILGAWALAWMSIFDWVHYFQNWNRAA